MKTVEYTTAFGVGAVAYTFIEILWRGYTHPSMTITGGICMALMYMWNNILRGRPKPLKWLVGALSVTAVEFAVGCIVNLWLNRHVWDYSSLPFNLLGQVSLTFFFLWFLLSIIGFRLCDLIRKTVTRYDF